MKIILLLIVLLAGSVGALAAGNTPIGYDPGSITSGSQANLNGPVIYFKNAGVGYAANSAFSIGGWDAGNVTSLGSGLSLSSGVLSATGTGGGGGSGIPVTNGTGSGTTLTGTTTISALNGAIINVKGAPYNATGNGSTDDTAAINAAIGTVNSGTGDTLYFPPGTYLTGTGLATITAPFRVLGSGKIGPPGVSTNMGSTVVCSSGTANCFNVTARSGQFRDISVVNSFNTPTGGAGILFNPANKNDSCSYESVTVIGFWNDIYQASGEYWTMDHCLISGFVNYGMLIRNVQNSDYGDWCISNSTFSPDGYNGVAGVRYESSGGGKFINCKFNQSFSTTNNMATCIDVNSTVSGSSTIIFLVDQCSFENYTSAGIHMNATYLPDTIITGCEFGQWGGAGDTTAIPMNITNTSNVTVGTNIIDGFGTTAAVTLNGVTNATVYPQTLAAGRAYTQLSQTSCSEITVISGTSGTILAFGPTATLTDGATVTGTCNAGYVTQTWTLAHSGASTVTFAQPVNLTAGMQGVIQVTDASSATYNFPSGWVSSGGTPESLTMSGTATFAWSSTSSTSAIITSGSYAN